MKTILTLAGIKLALSAARTQGHITNDQLEIIAGILQDAAMGLELDADEMRAGSPVLNRQRASPLGDLSATFEEAVL